jgi:hypothetical protein
MRSEELKSCPFCGNEKVTDLPTIDSPLYDIYCPKCDCRFSWLSQDHDEAIKRYNQRDSDKYKKCGICHWYNMYDIIDNVCTVGLITNISRERNDTCDKWRMME